MKLSKTNVEDKVIIAYSGHGLVSDSLDYYLSTYSINFSKPEQGGLPYQDLEFLVDGIPARRKLLLIDACHSGELDRENVFKARAIRQKLDSTRGAEVIFISDNVKIGMVNSFELMRQLFVGFGKNTGATIISAAAGTQFAMERGDLKNGVFTSCILELMRTHKEIKLSELKLRVAMEVEKLTNGQQKPTFRNETLSFDWTVW